MLGDELTEAGKTILSQFTLFNKAVIFYETQISPVISTAIDTHVSTWLEENDWKGETDVSDTLEDLWTCPANWLENDEDEPFARFKLELRDEEGTDSYEIADLFRVGQSEFGFRFHPEHSWFGGKSQWNQTVKGMGDLIGSITENGWINEGKGILFRPIPMSADVLVEAWENEDWEIALSPITYVLDSIRTDIRMFDRMILKANPKAR